MRAPRVRVREARVRDPRVRVREARAVRRADHAVEKAKARRASLASLGSASTASSMARVKTMMAPWHRPPLVRPASGGAALRMQMGTIMPTMSMGSQTPKRSE